MKRAQQQPIADLGKQALFCLEQALGAMARTGSRPRGTGAPTPAPGTPEQQQPVGTRPAYATMVQQIRGRQGPRVS